MFALSESVASFDARGFHKGDEPSRRRLEHIGKIFIAGFNGALVATDIGAVSASFDALDRDHVGFAIEGAAMGAAIADVLCPGFRRLERWFTLNPRHTYLVHVGAGWALARMSWRKKAILSNADPIHGALIYDGMGFHDAYFKPQRALRGWRRIDDGPVALAYDGGIGRAIWFVAGGDIDVAAASIGKFPPSRQGELWSGLGLAIAYAGGADDSVLSRVPQLACSYMADVAQGVAFAAEAHMRAEHLPNHTARACARLTERDARQLVEIVRHERACISFSQSLPHQERFQLWRQRLRAALAQSNGGSHE
jgi:hypothetical protein